MNTCLWTLFPDSSCSHANKPPLGKRAPVEGETSIHRHVGVGGHNHVQMGGGVGHSHVGVGGRHSHVDVGGHNHVQLGGGGGHSHVGVGGGRHSHVDKKVAADYYLRTARYSPASGNRRQQPESIGQQKVAFGSSAPRWPLKADSRSTLYGGGSRERDSGKLRAQPVGASRPTVPSYLPSFPPGGVGREDRRGVGTRKWDVQPQRTDARQGEGDGEGGWRLPLVPRRPTVAPGGSYHSSVSTTKRGNVHGRTDWSAK